MKLEEKTVGMVGVAFLAGFVLCYYMMGSSSPAAVKKPVLINSLPGGQLTSTRPGEMRILKREADLRTGVTHQIIQRKVDITPSRAVNSAPRLEIHRDVPLPQFRYKANQDLIDFQYQPQINVREILTDP